MSVELNTVVQEVVIDDSKSAQGAARVVDSMEQMAAAADKVDAANQRTAAGFGALDAALKASTPAQESALRRLNSWKAQADPVESALQRLSRAEQDLNRAITQGISTEQEKARVLDQLWKKLLGTAEAQEKLNAAMRAQEAQTSFNAQLGVRDNFDTAKRAADVAAYGQELDRLQQKYAPLAAAQALYERQIEEINQAQRVGALTAEEAAAALAMNEAGYKRSVTAIQSSQQAVMGHTGAVKLQSWQIANLGQQLQDVFVQMQMGANPFTILSQQGPQITTAMGGVRNALALVLEWINPVYVGLGLLAGAVALVSARAVSLQSDARAMSVSLRAWGKDAEITTGQVKDYVDELKNYGVAQKDAITAAQASIAASGSTASDLTRQAAVDAANFSAAYGTSIEEATKKLIELRTQGYPAIRSLDEAYRFLTDAQAKHVRELVESGQQAAAMEIAYAALQSRIKGLADDAMSPLGRALKDTKREWADLLDTAAESDVVVGFVESLGGAFQAIADTLRGDLTDAWDAWVQHVVNDPAITLIEKIVDYKPAALRGMLENTPGTEEYVSARSNQGSAYSGSFAQFTASVGAGSSNPKLRNEIDEQIAAYDREMGVMRQSAATRDAYRVKLETEIEWRKRGADETKVQEVAEKAYQVALARTVVAVNDNIAALSMQAAQLDKVAKAYGISSAAGKDAELRMQAYIATTARGVAGEEAYYQALRRVADEQRAVAEAQKLSSERLETYVATEEARIARILDPEVRHQEELKLERQAKINELVREYGSLTEQAMKHLAEFDAQQAANDQKRYWEEVRDRAEDVSGDISDFLVDGFVNVEEAGGSVFKNIWDGALAGAKRFVANLAAEFLKQRIILPIAMSVIGGSAGAFGIAGPSGGATVANIVAPGGGIIGGGGGGTGFLSGLGGLLNGGLHSSFLTGVGMSISNSGIGQMLGLSQAMPKGGTMLTGLGGSFSNALGNIGYGGIGGMLGGLLGFGSGNGLIDMGLSTLGGIGGSMLATSAVGTSIGSALGIGGAALGPIGAIVGGLVGTIAGGLFERKPSNNYAQVLIDTAAGSAGKPIFDPSERSQGTIDAATAMSDAFLQIASQLEEMTGGTGAPGAFVVAGERDGFQVGLGAKDINLFNAAQRGSMGSFSDPEDAMNWLIREYARSLEGIDADYQAVIKKSHNPEKLVERLDWVYRFKQAVEETEPQMSSVSDMIDAVNEKWGAMIAQAKDLGVATDDAIAARKRERDEIYRARGEQRMAFAMGLNQMRMSLDGDQRGLLSMQLEIDRQSQIQNAQSLLDAQIITAKQFRELSQLLDRQVIESLKSFDDSIAEAARNVANDNAASQLPFYQQSMDAATGIQSFLNQQLLGDASSLNPMQKIDEARRQYEALLADVRGGDIGKSGALTQSADTLLALTQERFSSSPAFASVEASIRSDLAALGQTITSDNFILERIEAATKAAGMENVKAVERAIAELKALREGFEREFYQLTQQLKAAA